MFGQALQVKIYQRGYWSAGTAAADQKQVKNPNKPSAFRAQKRLCHSAAPGKKALGGLFLRAGVCGCTLSPGAALRAGTGAPELFWGSHRTFFWSCSVQKCPDVDSGHGVDLCDPLPVVPTRSHLILFEHRWPGTSLVDHGAGAEVVKSPRACARTPLQGFICFN